ncbi:hypothetical protein BMS3Bbin06_00049 [bacterium BMS3Bbin06]|nr:hypothetical protein BMS3Abin08_02238 [bacterium BMS3Abin08]GBE33542.1 hypothetical protein BMS3Bbin06_00049 [bacterium BMS3Bbin06]
MTVRAFSCLDNRVFNEDALPIIPPLNRIMGYPTATALAIPGTTTIFLLIRFFNAGQIGCGACLKNLLNTATCHSELPCGRDRRASENCMFIFGVIPACRESFDLFGITRTIPDKPE